MTAASAKSRSDYELVVVGAGIIGSMTARLATAEYGWRVLIIDREQANMGATRVSAGLDIPYGSTPLRRAMTIESQAAYRYLRDRDPSLAIRDLALVCVASRDRIAVERERLVADWAFGGQEARAGLRRTLQGVRLGPEQVLFTGLTCSHGQPAEVARSLVRQAVATEACELRQGVEAARVSTDISDGLAVALSDGGTVRTNHVVVAPGPWAREGPAGSLARMSHVRVKKVAYLYVNAPPPDDAPVVLFLDEDAFLLPLPAQSRWLFSFTCQEWDVEPKQATLALTPDDWKVAMEALDRCCPALVDRCEAGNVFCDAYGPDSNPVVVADPARPGLVFAGAGSGSGFRLAPAIAARALRQVSVEPAKTVGDVTSRLQEVGDASSNA